jgi:two-component system, cell cycle sensor histidine kinase and response regulator CckA
MPSSGARILIAEDEPPLLRMLEVYLGRIGYGVTSARVPDEAWKALDDAPGAFDLAVLDATMAGASLPEILSRLLSSDPRLRVLVTSGYPLDMSRVVTAAGGRVVFLQKPFGPEVLAGAIRRMLAAKEEDV